jgi:hypothetical protein
MKYRANTDITTGLRKHLALVFFAVSLISYGCSIEPLGDLYDKNFVRDGEQVGDFLRLTFNPGPDLFPSWSSDGTRIAYSAWGYEELTSGQITINILSLDNGSSRRVSPVFSRIDYDFYPGWYNGDNNVAFIAFRGLNFQSPIEPTVTVVNLNDLEDIEENRFDMNSPIDFGIAPDGSAIAVSDFLLTYVFTGEVNDPGEAGSLPIRREVLSNSMTAVWYADWPPTGKGASKIEGTDGASGICWSHDSNTLAFSKDGYIYTIDSQGGVPELLFEGDYPDWSPDGTRIACELNGNIYVYRLSDGDRMQITTEGGNDPAWSPDSEKLAFSWPRYGNYDIYIVELADL